MTILRYLIARLREASSYAGLVGALLGVLHIAASPGLIQAALGVVAALGGLLAVLIPERAAATVARCLLPLALVGALAAGLSACSHPAATVAAPTATTAAAKAGAAPLNGLAGFVTADLDNALSLAKAANDQAGAQCYAYLIPQVAAAQQQLGTLTTPGAVSGGFSAFEAGRVAATNLKGFVNGVPQGLNLACAPLVLDAGNTLVALAAKIGVTIALPATGLLPLP
jgi:hypothetical protein